MAAQVVLGLAFGVAQAVLPLLQGTGAFVQQQRASVSEQALAADLALYKSFRLRRNAFGELLVQTRIAGAASQYRLIVIHSLPPVWSARTRWELDMAISAVRREIDR